jgi:hypothetical protein
VRKVFISYARQNRPDIDQLVEHLGVLGCDTWVDKSLHGGQDWWEEILRRIADCDTFIAIISHEALNSTACRREFDWAESLGKPVLPVAIQPPPRALPGRFVRRQIIDYSSPTDRDRAALTLAGGLATLPSAPPLPEPLPESPAAPLSYLTDIIDLVSQQQALDHDQQRHILNQLEPAFHSVDPEERRGGHDILETLGSRDDLYADAYRTITRLKSLSEQPLPVGREQDSTDATSAAIAEPPASTRHPVAQPATPSATSDNPASAPARHAEPHEVDGESSRQSKPPAPAASPATGEPRSARKRPAEKGSRAVASFATIAVLGLIALLVGHFVAGILIDPGILLFLVGLVGALISHAKSRSNSPKRGTP